MKQSFFKRALFIGLLVIIQGCQQKIVQHKTTHETWPSVTRETKPWSRWWWQGSAVTKDGITSELEAFKDAGLGGLEITPIYGVLGYEDQFVEYLSPQWMDLFMHTLREAERLDLGIDMATGTGWPFGGPWVTEADACKNIEYRLYELSAGESLKEKIEFVQPSFLRVAGNQIYKRSVRDENSRVDLPKATFDNLIRPIEANKNLQALAIDQVKFSRPLDIKALRGYDEQNNVVDLLEKLDSNNFLRWTAPKGKWRIYAVFEGSHGKMVERAGPGGEGNVIDHFSNAAVKNYLSHFDVAMKDHDVTSLRAFFNDSYEVDDAKGAADWTPELFNAFQLKHGYDLRDHLPALFNQDANTEKNERILSDYRETIADLVLNNFTMSWKSWAHAKKALIRNQAHGSPSNILDLYGVVDIPEIEGTEPLRIKMASSVGNVMGKKLVSSESATWLNEHFESNLADIKKAVDLFLVNGVNHIFYHGTCYSPKEAPWPGWLFYAAVHLNTRNPLWKDFSALNKYITRSQSLLQATKAAHDVLLYFPIYDRYATHGAEMIEHFDGLGKQFENTAFERSAIFLSERGYTFDFISDRQIGNAVVQDKKIKTEGGALYQTIVIPKCKYMPLKTLSALSTLVSQGATIVIVDDFPESFSGYKDLKESEQMFDNVIERMTLAPGVLKGSDLQGLLEKAHVKREQLVDHGLQFERKQDALGRTVYFIRNETQMTFDGWIPLNEKASSILIQDPMSGLSGAAKIRAEKTGVTMVYLQLTPGQSVFLTTMTPDNIEQPYPYTKLAGNATAVTGPWTVTFKAGGPTLPKTIITSSLSSWTLFEGDGYERFSGTAAYVVRFAKPAVKSRHWLLDLGEVKESAVVVLNGKAIGTLIGPVYQLMIEDQILSNENVLEVHVSNLMANRIADLDRRGIPWKNFYNVNFPARKSENRFNGLFDAAHWKPHASGLLGPVMLRPVTIQ